MHLLYYWRGDNYSKDLDWGAGYNLNQSNPIFHQVEIGESVWAFTRCDDGRYALAAELVVSAKTLNPPNFRYGIYRVWGSLENSRYFKVEDQPTVETIVRNLSCRAEAKYLGQSFQGHAAVRGLNNEDHLKLLSYAKHLDLEKRARLLPEEKIEAEILMGDSAILRELLQNEDAGLAQKRRDYLLKHVPVRDRELVKELREIYKGKCQISGWDPRSDFGKDLCEAHHIQWLSRGGEDSIQNLVLISPNIHRAIHTCDAPFDFGDGTFVFKSKRARLLENNHLKIRN
jgi:5-methylcytosine-specific restriction enzyme A